MKGIILILALPLIWGCQQPQYAPDTVSDQVTHQQVWEREDKNKEYETANAGYAGGFACHTADGGCLHFTCSTEKSCTYMQAAMKGCAKPEVGSASPMALDRLLIKDESCETAQQPQPDTMSITGGYTEYQSGNGDTILSQQEVNGYRITNILHANGRHTIMTCRIGDDGSECSGQDY